MTESVLLTQEHVTLFEHVAKTLSLGQFCFKSLTTGTHRSMAQIKLTPWHGQMQVIIFKEDVEIQKSREDGHDTEKQSCLIEIE